MRIFKAIFIVLFILFSQLPVMAQSYDPVIYIPTGSPSFSEFADDLEKQTGIQVYYKEEWVKDVKISSSKDSMRLSGLLNSHLLPLNIRYSFAPGNRLYILPGEKLIAKLPGYQVGENQGTEKDTTKRSEIEQRYLQGRKADTKANILIGNRGAEFSGKPVTITGQVTNSETGEPVIGASLVILDSGKGSITDENGNVSMVLKPGKYDARFSFVGMKNESIVLEVYESGSFNFQLEPEVIALTEVQIVGNENRKVQGTDMGLERINVSAIKQLPVLMGEKDIIKVSKLLPGIVSASEASSGLNVRGGNADQNMFYIQDIPLFNTSHSFGFFSAFNSDIVRDFSVYKGNIPARFGGRLSSVFDISTKTGNLKKYTAKAGISPISANFTAEGPIVKDKSSVLVSGRSSYSDWLLGRVKDPLIRNSNAFFYDWAASVYTKLGDKDNLNLFVYNSYDRIKLHELSNYEYQNLGASLKWSHRFNPSLKSEVSLIHSTYDFTTESISIPSVAYKHNYKIGHNEAKINFSLLAGLNHELNFGGNIIYNPLVRGKVLPLGEESVRETLDLGEERGVQAALYLSDRINITRWLTIYGGIRLNAYSYLGPATVNIYPENAEKLEESIISQDVYDDWERVTTHYDPAIRSGLNLKLGRNTSFKASFSQMFQYLFMASNTVTIAPNDQWKLSDYHLKPQSSYQYSAGLYQNFPDIDLIASVEYYRKESDNILEYKDGADFVNIPDAEMSILQGHQSTEGIEFMLEKKSGRVEGWVSYTWSRSLMKVDGENFYEQINQGNLYPSNYDKPHVLNLVGTFHINRIFTLSSSIVYSSGRPFTRPQSIYFIDDKPYISFGERNAERMPYYFRTDLSLTVEGNLKRDKKFHSTWIFNVYNIAGRNNPQSIFFRSEEGEINGYQLSIIGVPIFTITWSIKLGNYAS